MSNKFTPIQQITITIETDGKVARLVNEVKGFTDIFQIIGVLEASKRDILEDADSLLPNQSQKKPPSISKTTPQA